ncbi:Nuclear factor NF-kappa-B p110 subunit [Frankliniella fusca]|uniref:Nuclear factor NF-kappa-B p110 subunit n=1 Tax=Frankliniella fusca TaxID=407009 RepID=A0AAE1H5H4_9NEOP|nr:Nuclear factor NF-kappa-B p110 subunit [Frankliniella fusca]
MAGSEVAYYYSNFFQELQPPGHLSQTCLQSSVIGATMFPTPSPSPHNQVSPSWDSEEDMHYNPEDVHLKIIEQPVSMFRFRYRSEMNGAHGSLLGRGENPKKKTYPAVELVNFEGEATIRCSLYTASSPHIPHMHQLIAKATNQEEMLDHEVIVSERNGYRAEFRGLGIVHMAKKNLTKELMRKKEIIFMERFKKDAPQIEEARLKRAFKEYLPELEKEAKKEAETMDANKLRLYFEAFVRGPHGEINYLCKGVFSDTIQNMKSAETGGLKICRIDKCAGSCTGGDEIFILVEKVCKKNVQICFYEEDENGVESWHDYGVFSEHDVHHQYAIVFRTPPYKSTDIGCDVKVKIRLVRPKDEAKSDPVEFKYKPARRYGKRPLPSYSSLESNSSSFDALTKRPKPQVMVSGEDPMLSGEKSNSWTLPSDTIKEAIKNVDLNNWTEFYDFLHSSDFSEYVASSGGENVSKETECKRLEKLQFISEALQTDLSDMPTVNALEDFGDINFGNAWEAECDGQGFGGKPKNIVVTDGDGIATPSDEINRNTSSFAKQTCGKLLKLMKSRHPSRLQDMKNIIRAEDKEFGPLHAAVIHGQLKELGDLLSLVIKSNQLKLINTVNRRGQSPLLVAVEENQVECLKLLCMAKADVNQPDYEENTALHIAAKNKNAVCLEVILSTSDSSLKINLDKRNEKGETALHIAVMKSDLDCTTLLVKAGAELNVKTGTSGSTPLHTAVEVNSSEIVNLLLNQENINVNEVNFSNKTPYELIKPSQKSIILLFKKFQGDLSKEIGNQSGVDEEGDDDQDLDEDEDDDENEDDDEDENEDDDDDVYEDGENMDEMELEEPKRQYDVAPHQKSNRVVDNVQTDEVAEEDNGGSDSGNSLRSESKGNGSKKGDFTLIDDATRTILIESLDKDKKWRVVCENLNCSFLKRTFASVPSPSRILLTYLEFEKKISLSEFKNALEDLNVPEAIQALDTLLSTKR